MRLINYLTFLCLFVNGCKSAKPEKPEVNDKVYKVHYSNIPIKLDGKLDEPEWNKAKSLNLKPFGRGRCVESGTVKILWDDKYIYFGGVFNDSDIVQEAKTDGEHHYRTGDVMEVFLKPSDKKFYWEIYATPNNLKTTFFFLSRGRKLPSSFRYRMPGIIVASSYEGTFNNAVDRDKQWITELAVPIKELEKHGTKITPGAVWNFLIGRYNYSVYLDHVELTSIGLWRTRNFHDFRSWRSLEFVKGN